MEIIKDLFSFLRIEAGEISIKSPKLFEAFGIPFTGPMITALTITLLLLVSVVFISPRIKIKGKPGKLQTALEMIYVWFFDLVEKIARSPKTARQIMPIIMAIFVYIALSNTIALLPIIGSITYDGKAIFTTSTKDLNITFGIAATVVLWTHVLSILKYNPINHIFKFIKLNQLVKGIRKGPGGIFMAVIEFFIGLLDVISEFAKSLSLSLRLFGNMFAGEVLTTLLMSAFAIILPAGLIFYGVFGGVLQALVFAALSASYFGASLSDD